MDILRALAGIGVALFMMVAPNLGLPYLDAIPIVGQGGEGAGDQELARVGLEVGEPVPLMTLDPGGNRSALRVLWVEVEGSKMEHAGQGSGRVQRLRVAVAAPASLSLGEDVLRLRPGDEVVIEGFQGKWAYAPEGMVGVFRMEGTVLAARISDKGLQALGTDEERVAPGWALSGQPDVANVTVRAGRSSFVSTESREGDEALKHLRATEVRINGGRVETTKWGEGALDSVAFTLAAPGILRGEGGEREVLPGQRVEVADFVGAYVVFHVKDGESRVALEGYAARVDVTEAATPRTTMVPVGAVPLANFEVTPPRPHTGEPVKFLDRSTDPDGRIVARHWSFGDGNTSSDESPSHAYEDDGTFKVTLVVTDHKLVTASVSKNLTVLNTPPAALWETNPAAPTARDTVQFMDSSRDPDGRVVAWAWDFGDGGASSEQHPTHQFPRRGTYNLTLTVWDDDGDTATRTAPFQVRNLLPRAAFAWGPVSPSTGQSVQFQDQSQDEDGLVTAWSWAFGDGSTSTERNPVHAFFKKGFHRVRLTAHDDAGGSHTWEQVLDVRNAPPKAEFRVAPDPPAEGQPARFIDLSTDPDGRVLERLWSFGDGSTSTQAQADHTYLAGGNFTVTLTVRDDDGARSTAARSMTINRRPVPAFSFAPAQPSTSAPVQFTDASVDPDGSIATWSWAFGDGGASSTRNPQHAYARPGTFPVSLTVVDNQGASATRTQNLTIAGVGPVADFRWDPASPTTADTITFRDLSNDPDGAIQERAWDFGDGTSASGALATKRFPVPGAYPVTLTVTDAEGHADTAIKHLVVNGAPVAAFGVSPTNPSTGTPVRFTDQSTDPEGPLAAWSWDFGDGTASAEQSPTHTFASAGLHVVRLTVTDGQGATASTARNLTVGSVPPMAAFSLSPDPPLAGEPVQFVDESQDLDGSVVNWTWAFGDGGRSWAPSPVHTFAFTGPRAVTLTVRDDRGQTNTTLRNVLVRSAGALDVAFQVVYPDGQPMNLARDGVEVVLRDTASGTELSKGGARPLLVGADGFARGRLEAGEWAPGDRVLMTLRIPAIQVDATRAAFLGEGGDLGQVVPRMALVGGMGLDPAKAPSRDEQVYTDPTELVTGRVALTWKDGTPVRGALVVLEHTWEQLGWNSRPIADREPIPVRTGSGGTAEFAVPYATGLTTGPGAYLPGLHRLRGRVELPGIEPSSWAGTAWFFEEPFGARSLPV